MSTDQNEKLSCWLGDETKYEDLSGREQESYNAAHLMAQMAKWGYLEGSKVNGDKWGADLLFYRSEDGDVIKVQLKGRVTLSRHYRGKGIHVAYRNRDTEEWFLYNHDILLDQVLSKGYLTGTKSWEEKGGWSWSSNPPWLQELVDPWCISTGYVQPQKEWVQQTLPFRGEEVTGIQRWTEDWAEEAIEVT